MTAQTYDTEEVYLFRGEPLVLVCRPTFVHNGTPPPLRAVIGVWRLIRFPLCFRFYYG